MGRLTYKFLTIAVILLIFAIAAFGATYLPSYQECVAEHGNQTSQEKKPGGNQSIFSGPQIPLFFRCEGTTIDENSGTLLFLVTASLAWIARQQYITTRAQLRAYVFVTNARIGKSDDVPDYIEIVMTIENSGKTPAYDVTIWADCMLTNDVKTEALDKTKNPEVGKTTLAPNGGHASTSFFKKDFSAEQKEALRTSVKIGVLVYGEIRYVDVFKQNHRTKFRLVQYGGSELVNRPIAFTDKGNEAT